MTANESANPKSDYPAMPERQYFTIGEAAQLARSSPHILRYWEKEIPLKIGRRNGRRYYSREQVITLRRISRMLAEGATLRGAGKRLQGAPKQGASDEWLRRELEKVLNIL